MIGQKAVDELKPVASAMSVRTRGVVFDCKAKQAP